VETLSLEEFSERVDRILIERNLTEQRWEEPLPPSISYYKRSTDDVFDGLLVSWSTGGASGGSCWENSDPQGYTSNEPPAELSSLDIILEDICPSMTFLAFRRLKTLIEKGDYRVREYYGNYTDHRYECISLAKFHDFLVAEDLILTPSVSCALR
jgi:hypothetical protein